MAGRLGLDETEALGEFGGDQVAQRYIVDQPDQADLAQRIRCRNALRHIAGDHADLGLHVAAPSLIGEHDRLARAAQVVAAALIHQRIVPEAFGQLCPARLAHQLNVIDVGRAICPLIGPRQWCGGFALVKAFARDRAVLKLGGKCAQGRLMPLPIVKRGLKRRHQVIGRGEPGQIVRNHDQAAIAAMRKRSQFHAVILRGRRPVGGCAPAAP